MTTDKVGIFVAIIAGVIGVAAFFSANKAARQTAKSADRAVDAQAYERARDSYEAALETQEETIENLKSTNSNLKATNRKLEETNNNLRATNTELRVEIGKLHMEVTNLRKINERLGARLDVLDQENGRNGGQDGTD